MDVGTLIDRSPRVVPGDLLDPGLALALTVMAQVQLPAHAPGWTRAAMLVTTGSLAWRRRATLLVVVTVAASVGVMGLSANPPSVFGEYLAVMLAAFSAAERLQLLPAIAGLLVLVTGIVLHDWRSPQFGGLSGFVSDSAIPVVIWCVGRAVHLQGSRVDRSHRVIQQLEAEREALAEAAVAEERARLARELHDIVTHSLSVIVIQAQGAQQVLAEDPGQTGAALRVIESAGRSTLTEMRRLLGLMRDDATVPRSPQPGLADLALLVEQVQSAGLPVTLTSVGEQVPLDPGLELAGYRIVQESLTNSLKYARPATAAVSVRWEDGCLDLEVTDTGAARGDAVGSGRGLVGMRERVLAYGGHMEAGPLPGGGFRVHCRLPIGEPA